MIGIFDSGVGGLSVYREIRKLLPDTQIVYFADTEHCPYGEKSREYIIGRARTITEILINEGAKAIVVACNTATAAAISTLREEYPDIPFIGMEPAIKPAATATKTGIVGVLATAGTLKAQKYQHTREQYAEGVKVVEHVGQGFVELVEKGILAGPEAENIVIESIKPLIDAGADMIVLGCTHYPFLSNTILAVASSLAPSREIKIIDPAPAVAKQVVKIMTANGLMPDGETGGGIKLMTSGDIKTV